MRSTGLVVVLALLAGCGAALAPAPARDTTAQPPTLGPTAPARVDEPTYTLSLEGATNPQAEEAVPFTLVLEGRGGYHVNLEYPISIELGASTGGSVAQPKLGTTDAIEMNEDRARFETRVHWTTPGNHWLAARVLFAVCTPETCVPREQWLAVTVQVQ